MIKIPGRKLPADSIIKIGNINTNELLSGIHVRFLRLVITWEINNEQKLQFRSAMKYREVNAVTLNTPLLFKPPQKLRDFRDGGRSRGGHRAEEA